MGYPPPFFFVYQRTANFWLRVVQGIEAVTLEPQSYESLCITINAIPPAPTTARILIGKT